MISILLSPLSYLRVRRDGKVKIDFVYPFLLASIAVVLLGWFAPDSMLANKDGLADRLQLFASVLPGFYIAALGAIAAFTNPSLDGYFVGEDAILVENLNGHKVPVKLTRRRFLTLLFAYLCMAGLALFITCIFVLLVGHSLAAALPAWSRFPTKICGTFVILFLFFQCITCTCLGLYYLGSRLHTP